MTTLWKQLIPDISVDSLIDMSREELLQIEAVVNSGTIDSGGRILDTVLSPKEGSSVVVVLVNSTVSFTAPPSERPILFRRRREVETGNIRYPTIGAKFAQLAKDIQAEADTMTGKEYVTTVLGMLFLCCCIW